MKEQAGVTIGELLAILTPLSLVVGASFTWLWLRFRDLLAEYRTNAAAVRAELDLCRANHSAEVAENAALKEQVKFLDRDIKYLQATHAADAPSSAAAVTITAGLRDMVIVDASPSVGSMLHYLPGDLVGKSVEQIIPDRYLSRHRAAVAKCAEAGRAGDDPRSVVGFARTREGAELPVVIVLSAWQDDQGRGMVTAEITNRRPRPRRAGGGQRQGDDGSGPHPALPAG